MGLNSFIAREPRPLPIIVLADTSGSMRGNKIDELNLSLRDMVSTLRGADDIRGKFQLAVVSFGEHVRLVQPLRDIEDIELPELSASGRTPLGQAIERVKEMIEDKEVISSRAYTPTIVLISDGMPTDCTEEMCERGNYSEWQPLRDLCTDGRSARCQRLALGIGEDADLNMLKAFIGNPSIPVIRVKDSSDILKFFRWVTMSTVARINSVRPDDAEFLVPVFDIDDEDIII